MKVRYKRAALSDLVAIRDYGVSHWGVARTVDFVDGLIDVIEGLDGRPSSGRPRSEIAPGMRSVRHRGYAVFFVVLDDQSVVLAVLSERQNLAAVDFADRLDDD